MSLNVSPSGSRLLCGEFQIPLITTQNPHGNSSDVNLLPALVTLAQERNVLEQHMDQPMGTNQWIIGFCMPGLVLLFEIKLFLCTIPFFVQLFLFTQSFYSTTIDMIFLDGVGLVEWGLVQVMWHLRVRLLWRRPGSLVSPRTLTWDWPDTDKHPRRNTS